jgi:catechol 2,3-dioxygenase-like lactoylglutathione lyase family enzyme
LIKGIEHTAIAARDAAALASWYESVLGFAIVYRSANAIFVRAEDGSMIEIINADGDRGPQTMKTQGIRHICLAVTEFDDVYAGLQKNGVAFEGEPEDKKGNKVVFFKDPEGNILHLLQRSTPLA